MQGCKEAGIPAFGTLWDFVGVIFSTGRLLVCWHLTSERSDRMMTQLYARSVLSHAVDGVEYAQLETRWDNKCWDNKHAST